MPTGIPLTAVQVQVLRNRATFHAAARQRVLLLEEENTNLKKRLKDTEAVAQEWQRRALEAEERLKKEQDANKKLRAMLFKREHPYRTQRAEPSLPRTAQSYRRVPPTRVTERKTLALEQCPDCGSAVSPPQSSRTRIIEDIVFNPQTQVTAWTILRHYCSNCQHLVEGVVPGVLPRTTIGPNTLTYVVLAKYRWNLPYEKIQDNLTISFGLTVAVFWSTASRISAWRCLPALMLLAFRRTTTMPSGCLEN